MQAIIKKNGAAEKSFLKVRLPEPEMVQNLFSAFNGSPAGVLKKQVQEVD
jgi:hypothetical protein